jgi:tRNA U34 5-methylaminomethyl-2-thiouridine-forming methyltransferase MnmC
VPFSRKCILTADGSKTLRIEHLKETYHSRHGAFQESQFVYIEQGLQFLIQKHSKPVVRILELGYGTGLMAFMTYRRALQINNRIEYTSIDPFPINEEELRYLEYDTLFSPLDSSDSFSSFSSLSWNHAHTVKDSFKLHKKNVTFQDFQSETPFDLLYYDAFGAHAQPELWEPEWMQKAYDLLDSGGVWVSYCAKGTVRRALEKAGFEVSRLPGPPGKREMMRAVKP